jgi:hypothetical protein
VRRLLLAFIPFIAAEADAQIVRPGGMRFQEPQAWVSAGVTLMQPFYVRDGSTGTEWQFSDATQYVASLEKTLSGGATLGLQGTHARVPLRYAFIGGGSPTDADANVSQLFAKLHVSSGREFHSVLELGAGATMYYDFRERGTGARLQPTNMDTDFTFAFGYGFGYNFSPSFAIDVVQDLTTVLHQKTGLRAGDNSSVRINGTRFIVRLGLGGH